jgi:hypothetical protein
MVSRADEVARLIETAAEALTADTGLSAR